MSLRRYSGNIMLQSALDTYGGMRYHKHSYAQMSSITVKIEQTNQMLMELSMFQIYSVTVCFRYPRRKGDSINICYMDIHYYQIEQTNQIFKLNSEFLTYGS